MRERERDRKSHPYLPPSGLKQWWCPAGPGKPKLARKAKQATPQHMADAHETRGRGRGGIDAAVEWDNARTASTPDPHPQHSQPDMQQPTMHARRTSKNCRCKPNSTTGGLGELKSDRAVTTHLDRDEDEGARRRLAAAAKGGLGPSGLLSSCDHHHLRPLRPLP